MIVIALLGVLAAPIIAMTKAISVSTEFFSMIDAKPVERDGLQEPDVSSHDDIEFKNVFFSYPTRSEVQVLKGFSARFPKGKTTALVGPSGSGKSTIVALLERWYELQGAEDEDEKASADATNSSPQPVNPDQGTITIGNHDITETNLKWWRSQIGLVQQEPFMFNDTIFNNVSFGLLGTKWEKESDEVKLERVKNACKEAFADEFIMRLPDVSEMSFAASRGANSRQGYQTKVGESGIKLSGGQRQRLAIARSIVREPTILILDEATSSIDVRGERIVQKALELVSRNRTTVVIAHRLSTIRKADNIIVIRDGRNLEEGTHDHLLSLPDGFYASLVHAQQLEAETAPKESEVDEVALDDLERSESTGALKTFQEETSTTYKKRGFFRSVGQLLYEQRQYWKYYVAVVIAAMAAGCK